jgi:hypothetical protein
MQTVPTETTKIGGPVPYTNIDILSSDILIEEFKNLSKIKLYNFNKIIGTAYEKAEYLKSSGNKGKGLQGEQFKKIQPDNPGFIIKDDNDNREDEKKSWKILFLNDLENTVNNMKENDDTNNNDTNNTDHNKRSIMHLIGKYSYYFLKWHYDVPIKLGGSKVRWDYKYIKLIKTIEKILNPSKQGGGGPPSGGTKDDDINNTNDINNIDDNLTYINSGLTGIKYNKDLDEIFKTLEEFMRDGIVKQLNKEIKRIITNLKKSISDINKNYTEKIQKKEAAKAAKAAKASPTSEDVKWIYRGKRLPQKGEIVERIHSMKNINNMWEENKIEDWEIKEDLASILNKTSFGSNITFKKYFDVYLPTTNKINENRKRIENLLKNNLAKLDENYTYVDENEKRIDVNIKDELKKLENKLRS